MTTLLVPSLPTPIPTTHPTAAQVVAYPALADMPCLPQRDSPSHAFPRLASSPRPTPTIQLSASPASPAQPGPVRLPNTSRPASAQHVPTSPPHPLLRRTHPALADFPTRHTARRPCRLPGPSRPRPTLSDCPTQRIPSQSPPLPTAQPTADLDPSALSCPRRQSRPSRACPPLPDYPRRSSPTRHSAPPHTSTCQHAPSPHGPFLADGPPPPIQTPRIPTRPAPTAPPGATQHGTALTDYPAPARVHPPTQPTRPPKATPPCSIRPNPTTPAYTDQHSPRPTDQGDLT